MATKKKKPLADVRLKEALDNLVSIIDTIERKQEFIDAYVMLDPDLVDGRNFRQVAFDSLLDTYIDATFALEKDDIPLEPYRILLEMRDQKKVSLRTARADFERERGIQMEDDYPFKEPECLSIFGNKPRIELIDVMPAWKRAAAALADTFRTDHALRVDDRMQRLLNRVTHQFDRRYETHEGLLQEKKNARKGDYNSDELNMLVLRAEDKELPPAAMKHLHSQLKLMDGMLETSGDYKSLLRALETLVSLPWNRQSRLISDIEETELRLDEKHYGLDKAKDIIAEHVAVQQRTGNSSGKVLCFNGAPGIGKTSLAQAIAYATGRTLVRIALGGVRDSVAIRGHSSTYTGALPGRIVKGLIEAGVKNPLFLLDEIDKVGTGNGDNPDVESALLEVIDPEQNSHFRDTYVDVEFDLSDVLFIATSNDKWNIMPALRDRMEVVDLPSYTSEKKLKIAQYHLLPQQMEKAGLSQDDISIPDETLKAIISKYVREPGVRELERLIEKICRKVAYKLEREDVDEIVEVKESDLTDYLGKPRIYSDMLTHKDSVGVSNGLGVAGSFGSVLPFEAIKMEGKDGLKIKRTGQMKEVMQESIDVVTSWIKANAKNHGVKPDDLEKIELHVDAVGDGAKDGPSAGIALLSACMSAIKDEPLRANLAMTGKLTLGGRVRAIGGTIEKLEGAMREGITTVLIPQANMRDLSDASDEIRSKLQIIPVETAEDVLKHVFATQVAAPKLLSYAASPESAPDKQDKPDRPIPAILARRAP